VFSKLILCGDAPPILALVVLAAQTAGCDAILLNPAKKDSRRISIVDGLGGGGPTGKASDAPITGVNEPTSPDCKLGTVDGSINPKSDKTRRDTARRDIAKSDLARTDTRRPDTARPPDLRRPDTARPPDLRRPDTARPPDTQNPNTLTSIELDLFNAINTERSGKGLGKVVIDPLLLCAARDAVSYCCYPLRHYNCDDGTARPGDRVVKCGGTSAQASKSSEIGAGPGFGSGSQVVSAWAGGAPHAAVLNHASATAVGVGGSSAGCYFAVFNVYPP
jgi:hypothetical protein